MVNLYCKSAFKLLTRYPFGQNGYITSVSLHIATICFCSIKIDPYINIDAGTFSPYEHGEVYVLDDGGEVDLDLGNYER